MILFFRCVGCRRGERYRAYTGRWDVLVGQSHLYACPARTSSCRGVAGKRIALALIKGTNLRGIVALIVHFERRAREHFRRERFDSIPDRFGGPGKAQIPQSRTTFCREQLGRCRVVEGGHAAHIDLFRKRRPYLKRISEIQRLLGPRLRPSRSRHECGFRHIVYLELRGQAAAAVVVLAAQISSVHGDSGGFRRFNANIMGGSTDSG